MLVIAHRGASAYAPENTRAAFDLAISMGSDLIETDIQITRDGELVLIHDDLVDRTTSGQGAVSDYSLAELQALDAGTWFDPSFAGERVMTLGDFWEAYVSQIPPCLEIKDPLATDAFAAFLLARPDRAAVQVSSFSWTALLRLQDQVDVTTGFLCKAFNLDVIERCVARGIDQICPPAALLDSALVEAAHERGLIVRAWGVRNREDVDRVYATNADGATTNWPDWMTEHPAHPKAGQP